MFKKTLLGLATGGALALAALAGSTGTAQAAGTYFDSGIAVPGVQLVHSRGTRCWLPERYLCDRHRYRRPYHGRPVYGRPVYGWPGYYGGYWGPPVIYRPYPHW